MHEVCSDQCGEGKWTFDDPIGVVCEPQQQKGDERDCNLNSHGVLGGSQEVPDFQGLLDPSKEQLDGPATLVKIADVLRGGGQIIGENAQYLASLDHHPDYEDETGTILRIFPND